jgi:DNA-binding CsgD family transcriptional regulator
MSHPDVSSAVESERRRLAQMLDAEIISSLELLQAQTNTYLDALRSNQQAQISLSILQSLIQQTIHKARYMQSNLHPGILETLGLEPALETLAADAKRVRGLTIKLTIPRLRERLPQELEVALFRAVQLLLDTAVAQAHAAHFELRLEQSEQTISLRYEDNGSWYPSDVRALYPLQADLQAINGHAELQIQSDRSLMAKLQVRISPSLSLTAREIEILQQVAEGLSNKEIAALLHLSARTVNFHLDNIYSKLHVSSRMEAVMLGLQQGWIQNPVK